MSIECTDERPLVDRAFGDVVAHLRQAAGLSQAKLSDALSWERSRIARIECARQPAKVADVLALEREFIRLGRLTRPGDLVWLAAATAEVWGQLTSQPTRRSA